MALNSEASEGSLLAGMEQCCGLSVMWSPLGHTNHDRGDGEVQLSAATV